MLNISIDEQTVEQSTTGLGHDPLSEAMVRLKDLARRNGSLSLSELIKAVDKEGPAFAAALLTLPFLQPIPLFGLSTPAGLTIALSGVGIFLQKPVYLPKRLGVIQLKSETILKMAEFLLAFQEKINPYIKNDTAVHSPLSLRFLGGCIAIHGVLLALPLPIPFSNAMPAWMCFLGALSVLFSSRRLFWLSATMVVLNVAFWLSLVAAAAWGLPSLVELSTSFFN
jgi:hypothetical protein